MEIGWKVLVTGITGFIGSHLAIQLLNRGYRVVGASRSPEKTEDLRKLLSRHTDHIHRLSFVKADLTDEKSWKGKMSGIDGVFHLASPFPQILPKDPDELIVPAREGTLNVLKEASKSGVKKVVLTSSVGAVAYGKTKENFKELYNENDWTGENGKDSTAYYDSKTIAEKAAWDFIDRDDGGMELTTICPGAVIGPPVNGKLSSSHGIVKKTMEGAAPFLPDMGYDLVDVRDVVDLHIRAMESDKASGERFIGSSGYLHFTDIAGTLGKAYPDRNIPKRIAPDFLIKAFSLIDKAVKPILIDLGKVRKLDHSKAEKVLGWKPRTPEETVLETADSLLEKGLLDD